MKLSVYDGMDLINEFEVRVPEDGKAIAHQCLGMDHIEEPYFRIDNSGSDFYIDGTVKNGKIAWEIIVLPKVA